jgi:membrane protein required for colicin V production
MSSFDLLLLVPIAMGAFNGYKRGLLIEIIGILAFITAIVFGFKFLGRGMEFIGEFIGEENSGKLLPYLSFIFIFFPTVFLINKLGWAFRKALRLTFMGTLDGIAGAALGAVLWFFGLSMLYWLVQSIGLSVPAKYAADSEVLPILETFAPNIVSRASDFIPMGGNLIQKFKEISAEQIAI